MSRHNVGEMFVYGLKGQLKVTETANHSNEMGFLLLLLASNATDDFVEDYKGKEKKLYALQLFGEIQR